MHIVLSSAGIKTVCLIAEENNEEQKELYGHVSMLIKFFEIGKSWNHTDHALSPFYSKTTRVGTVTWVQLHLPDLSWVEMLE